MHLKLHNHYSILQQMAMDLPIHHVLSPGTFLEIDDEEEYLQYSASFDRELPSQARVPVVQLGDNAHGPMSSEFSPVLTEADLRVTVRSNSRYCVPQLPHPSNGENLFTRREDPTLFVGYIMLNNYADHADAAYMHLPHKACRYTLQSIGFHPSFGGELQDYPERIRLL